MPFVGPPMDACATIPVGLFGRDDERFVFECGAGAQTTLFEIFDLLQLTIGNRLA